MATIVAGADRLTCPPRKDEADWLVEITGESGKAYHSDVEKGGVGVAKVPVTAEEFHSRWRESEMGKALEQARCRR